MGEASKLESNEALDVAKRMISRSGHMPIVVGVSAPGFVAMRSLSHNVMDAGAAGVMIAPPPSLRTDDQIVGYFEQAAEAIGPEVPSGAPGLSLGADGNHDGGCDSPHRRRHSLLRNAEA